MATQKFSIQLDLFTDSALWLHLIKRRRPPISEETRQKIRNNRLGRKWSEEAKRKMSESAKKRPQISEATRAKLRGRRTKEKNNRWKGGEVPLLCHNVLCGKTFYVRPYRVKHAKYCSVACRKNDPNKKSTLAHRIRESVEYKVWRLAVFTRDNFTCQDCGRKGESRKGSGPIVLNADHIKPFALFPELRFDINNGRTLCEECHHKTPTFGVHTWRREDFLLEVEL